MFLSLPVVFCKKFCVFAWMKYELRLVSESAGRGIRPRIKRMACAQREACCCQVAVPKSKIEKWGFHVATVLARPQHRWLLGERSQQQEACGILFHDSWKIKQALPHPPCLFLFFSTSFFSLPTSSFFFLLLSLKKIIFIHFYISLSPYQENHWTVNFADFVGMVLCSHSREDHSRADIRCLTAPLNHCHMPKYLLHFIKSFYLVFVLD